jgi:hypothetical protein
VDLFRLLLSKPRPWVPTDVVPGGRVFAISGLEQAAIDAACGPRTSTVARAKHEVVAGLYVGETPLVASAESAGQLRAVDLRGYHDAVRDGWSRCAPTYGGSFDVQAWMFALVEGAKALRTVTVSLGACIDITNGVERPDWWFSIPLRDLTDGQWMAYRAAARVVREERKNAR